MAEIVGERHLAMLSIEHHNMILSFSLYIMATQTIAEWGERVDSRIDSAKRCQRCSQVVGELCRLRNWRCLSRSNQDTAAVVRNFVTSAWNMSCVGN